MAGQNTGIGTDIHEYEELKGTLGSSMQRPLNGLPIQG